MRKFGFDNGYGTTFEHGIHFLEFPRFKYGQEVIEDKSVNGRVGTLTVHTGKYTDTIITNILEFESDSLGMFEDKIQKIKRWLLMTRELVYTDCENKFFHVKKVEISSEIRKHGVYGNLTVVFTCETFAYLKDGKKEILLPKTVHNPYLWSQPTYVIIGQGICNLSINGKIMTVNVSGDIVINTKLMISYHLDKTSQNTAVTGNYEDLYLQEGKNEISVTEGFNCKLIPNWRCL